MRSRESTLDINPTTPRPRSLHITNVWPQPAHGGGPLHLRWKHLHDASPQLQVFDILGRAVLSRQLPTTTGGGEILLDVSALPPGIYNLRLVSGENAATTVFVVQ
jgi:hypothetical protein